MSQQQVTSKTGQSQPRRREAGEWVQAPDENEGVTGPDAIKTESDLAKMSRAELDEHARSQGINPDDYKNRDELTKALGA